MEVSRNVPLDYGTHDPDSFANLNLRNNNEAGPRSSVLRVYNSSNLSSSPIYQV